MTVHSAKGLEFHTVFVTGLEEGLFPHENSLNETDGVEEERRLMYVAITRARRRLYLTHAQSRMLHGQVRATTSPSRFLDEMPRELVQWLSAACGAARSLSTGRSGTAEWARRPPVTATAARRRRHPRGASGRACGMRSSASGVIIDAEGRGSDARVQVNFRDAGVKWLALDYAKLEAA